MRASARGPLGLVRVYQGRGAFVTDRRSGLGEPMARWLDLHRTDRGLTAGDKLDFVTAAGLVAEPPMNPSPERWDQLLREFERARHLRRWRRS